MHVVRPAGAVMTAAELHRDPLARLLFPFIAGVFWGLGRDGEESGRRAAVLTASVVESIEEAVRKHGPVTERQLGEAAGRAVGRYFEALDRSDVEAARMLGEVLPAVNQTLRAFVDQQQAARDAGPAFPSMKH